VSQLPPGTVTLLFSDLEGSTQLLRRLRERYSEALGDYRALLGEAFARHGGRVLEVEGDSIYAVFERAAQALAGAADAQRALATHTWPDGEVVRARIGLHTGEPQIDGEQYVGLAVNRAARICSAAHGGQVLVSAASHALAHADELPDVTLRDLGTYSLKDFDRPERLFQLEVPGLAAAFPAPRVDAKPTLLLLRANEPVSSDRLVDELWGEDPPRTATTSLQNAVSQLRKLLGPGVLHTRPGGYVLEVGDAQLDLARFEQLVRDARAAEPEERANTLRTALALWRGAPLADCEFELFAQGEIQRLEEVRLNTLEERVEADLELGRHAEVAGELDALVRKHPLRERLRGLLMLALYRSGRQADALAAYHEARRTLVQELGIEPGPELQELYGSILRQERSLTPAVAVTLGDHYAEVGRALAAARLVPVLAGPVEDLTALLAERFDAPAAGGLAAAAQFVAVRNGVGPLNDELHAALDREFEPTALHRWLATVPRVLRERGLPQQLIVTTSFDTAVERAFADAGEPLDVVSYIADGRDRGRFLHETAEGSSVVVHEPNAYADLSLDERTVLLKVHGQVGRGHARERESFAVSEDDHIDYLAAAETAGALPVTLAARLRRSHLLFVGYPVQDWSLRVFLRRVWGADRLAYRSWAVQQAATPLARDLWRDRGVDVYDVDAETYATELARETAGLEPVES
jgi:DNA-binding SARP family transcriptional activator